MPLVHPLEKKFLTDVYEGFARPGKSQPISICMRCLSRITIWAVPIRMNKNAISQRGSPFHYKGGEGDDSGYGIKGVSAGVQILNVACLSATYWQRGRL